MAGQNDSSSGFVPLKVNLALGVTAGSWFGTTGSLVASVIQAQAGGTVFLIQNPSGLASGLSAPVAASLVAISSTYGFWVNPSQPPVTIPGPAPFYLYSMGTTTTCYVMQYFNNNPGTF